MTQSHNFHRWNRRITENRFWVWFRSSSVVSNWFFLVAGRGWIGQHVVLFVELQRLTYLLFKFESHSHHWKAYCLSSFTKEHLDQYTRNRSTTKPAENEPNRRADLAYSIVRNCISKFIQCTTTGILLWCRNFEWKRRTALEYNQHRTMWQNIKRSPSRS